MAAKMEGGRRRILNTLNCFPQGRGREGMIWNMRTGIVFIFFSSVL